MSTVKTFLIEPFDIMLHCPDAQSLDDIRRLEDLGVTDLQITPWTMPDTPARKASRVSKTSVAYATPCVSRTSAASSTSNAYFVALMCVPAGFGDIVFFRRPS